MTTAAVAFASATALGAILTHVVRALGLRLGAVDHALVSRKIHRRPVPRLGGVAIVLAFYAPLLALLLVDSDVGQEFYAHGRRAVALFIGGVAIAALGAYDDVKGAKASTKLVVQLGVAGLMYWAGFRIDHIASPFAQTIELGVLGIPFTMLWIVGVINAMNLIDGLDGLAAGVALIATLTTLIIASVHGETLIVLCAAALAGAILGFLFYNFNPASIFMGDTGSMFLGFVLATTAIHTNGRGSTTVAIIVPIVSLGLPIADTLLAMARRAARGVPMFRGDAGHIHHRLLERGLSHRKAVLVLYGACVVLAASALILAFAAAPLALWFLLALAGAAYFLLRHLGFLDLEGTQELMEQRRRNLLVQQLVRRAGEAVREARTPEELWKQVRRVGRILGASCVGFGIGIAGEEPATYSHGFDEAPLDLLRVRYGLTPERPGANYIELGWSDGRKSIDRDSEIAIELLCHHVAPVVERIEDARDDERSLRDSRSSGPERRRERTAPSGSTIASTPP